MNFIIYVYQSYMILVTLYQNLLSSFSTNRTNQFFRALLTKSMSTRNLNRINPIIFAFFAVDLIF